MKKSTLLVTTLILSFSMLFAQNQSKIIQLKSTKQNSVQEKADKAEGFMVSVNLNELKLDQKKLKGKNFENISINGLVKTYRLGEPALPVYSKLIHVPVGKTIDVSISTYTEEYVNLEEHEINNKIVPAQRSLTKSEDPEKAEFYLNDKIYSSDAFYENQLIKLERIGIMRDVELYRLEVSPLSYNPVRNQLLVKNNIELQVSIEGYNENQKLTESFNAILKSVSINPKQTKELITDDHITYVIVSDPMFEEALQPFIDWKKKIGYQVIEAYTKTAEVGTTTTSIKAYLKNLYDNPQQGFNKPSFVLFVGDVAQIPVFNGTTEAHKTDLYYCEYTGDLLPEVFYGRFSANTVSELLPQIEKTLQNEQYTMPETDYLNKAMVIAGVDASWAPTHGNGFVNYALSNYLNAANGITAYSYYYPESGSAGTEIRQKVSQGLALANYTAHCNEDGWGDPNFSISHISSMTNKDMYPLMIGNCCLSNKFDQHCFGEALLRAQDKGAVGYIGGSNNTLWDEDFYWGVGLVSNVSANPSYEQSGLGAYDRFIHSNDEPENEWYITQGQIIVAGNLAVQASASSNKAYYWEIYHLMGDPSLIPYLGVPETMTITNEESIPVGSTSLELTAEKNAYVALSKLVDGQRILLSSKRIVNETGSVTLEFDAIDSPGYESLDLTITKQNRQPVMKKITVFVPNGSYVVVSEINVDDANANNNQILETGETINLNLLLKNVGVAAATNTIVNVSSDDPYVQSISNNVDVNLGNIDVDASINSTNQFTVNLAQNVPDQHEISFTISVKDDSNSEEPWVYEKTLKVNAPKLEIGSISINDAMGDNIVNQILEAGESGELIIEVKNTGSYSIENVLVNIEQVSDAKLSILSSNIAIAQIAPGESQQAAFEVSVSDQVLDSYQVNFSIRAESQNYAALKDDKVTVNEIPDLIMGELSEVNVLNANFYDSGFDGFYQSNLNDTLTINPVLEGKFIQAMFTSFDVEKDYDWLKIYDGALAIPEKLIGMYDGNNYMNIGTNGLVSSSDSTGALTFVFYSDINLEKSGWHAEISNVENEKRHVFFKIHHNGTPLSNAVVKLNNVEARTNAEGVSHYYVDQVKGVPYTVFVEGYNYLTGTLDIEGYSVLKEVNMILTGIDKPEHKLSVYPNPSQGQFIITFDQFEESREIIVTDLSGRVIHSAQLKEENTSINLQNQTPGLYFYRILMKNGNLISGKLILK